MSDYYLDQVRPQCYVHCLAESLVNGVYDSTTFDDVMSSGEFGQMPEMSGGDHFLNYWRMSDDTSGSGDVGSMRLTLTHYADKMPMRWDWDWMEDGNTVSGFIELTGSTVTKIFTPTYTDFFTNSASNIVFTAPI